MKKFLSMAAAASVLLTATPALATTGPMKVVKKVNKTEIKMVKRMSPRLLQTSHKLTPSEACKTAWGKERAACVKAFTKAGMPQSGWVWTAWASSSSMSSTSSMMWSSTSSAATSATSSAASSWASSASSH